MTEKRGLLLIGGEAPAAGPNQNALWRGRARYSIVVAADSGLHHARRYGIMPDVIVGDFDSLDSNLLKVSYKGVPQERYSREKDLTDTEIGLNYLWTRKIDNVTILGGGGGRLDHLIGLIALFDREKCPSRWITDQAVVTALEEKNDFTATIGETVSFFPVGPDTCRMRSHGLRWKLDDLIWKKGDAGISNECVKERCTVEVVSGRLIMVRASNDPLAFLEKEE